MYVGPTRRRRFDLNWEPLRTKGRMRRRNEEIGSMPGTRKLPQEGVTDARKRGFGVSDSSAAANLIPSKSLHKQASGLTKRCAAGVRAHSDDYVSK